MSASRLLLTSVAAALALTLAGCSSGGTEAASSTPSSTTFTTPGPDDKGGKNDPVTIGTVGASGDQWTIFTTLAEQAGIYVELVDFTDYQQPNPATTSGELDLNQFQHLLFLAKYNNDSGSDLTPIGSTAIYPLGLYSTLYTSVADIPDGAQITVPNDGTNQARALGVLASAGLITLKDGTRSLSAAPEDIDTAASTVTVTPVAADQTARSLDDATVAGAVINNDYVTDTGLEPQDALAQDDPSSDAARPFINIWVVQAKDKDNPLYLKLVEIAQTAQVEDALLAQSGGTGVLVHESAANLQSYLADVEDQLKG
ncbi:MAG: MetQ/NlpA family ABC transporter substrate-binding protein [Cellulomonas sp.]|nr:MetQ/NlpA family ABC transporter substrate-binding protein [Cellulomonas sp.]